MPLDVVVAAAVGFRAKPEHVIELKEQALNKEEFRARGKKPLVASEAVLSAKKRERENQAKAKKLNEPKLEQ